jgi:LmbE family N-acetylglucosaminyl deacetylase
MGHPSSHFRPDARRRCAQASRRMLAGAFALLVCTLAPAKGHGQAQGAVELRQLVRGLTVTPRVLIVGAHPDDDDPLLIAWLARGRQVETGYLSLTRGEAGDNFIGDVGGVTLGAIRTGELLAARRIDGGRSFFTRAYDFGLSRSADEAFRHWSHDGLLADAITVVRSFRPHVIVVAFAEGFADGNGQHDAVERIAREVFDAAGDTTRCPASQCGAPWKPARLLHRGQGYTAHADDYDPVAGRTYADLALESRAQHRSEGLLDLFAPPRPQYFEVRRLPAIGAPARDSANVVREPSIFDGVDTSFARLSVDAPPAVAQLLAAFLAVADSTRAALDIAHPTAVVDQLARVAKLADTIRAAAVWCRHPSRDATLPALAVSQLGAAGAGTRGCTTRALDLDAAIDLVQRRSHEALLAAAGISIQTSAVSELATTTGRLIVNVTVSNHGTAPVTLEELSVSGAPDVNRAPVVIAPDSTRRVYRPASSFGPASQWWVGKRDSNAFQPVSSALDGVEQPGDAMAMATVAGVAVPEDIRRNSDVRATLTISGVTFSTSVGPIVYHSATPMLGAQDRPVAAVPPVTLTFERSLEWIPVGKPIDRTLRLSLRSYSDNAQTLSLLVALVPKGVRVDSLPRGITLAPHEQREVLVHIRGDLTPGRYQFGIVGKTPFGLQLSEGFDTFEFPHVPPVRSFRTSGLYLQALRIDVPAKLVVAFIRGVGDAGEDPLKQLGVPVRAFSPDELSQADLSIFTTVVVGPRAYELHPELAGQSSRLLAFARAGGTVVVLNGQRNARTSTLLPYPASLSLPLPEHVTAADAPVTVLEPRSRVLNWPNHIEPEDWKEWVRERALFVPTRADSHYVKVIEMHDAGQSENANSILVTPVGAGTYVYSTITFFEQLPGGVSGGLRLFVNLLSAGCRPTGVGPAKC